VSLLSMFQTDLAELKKQISGSLGMAFGPSTLAYLSSQNLQPDFIEIAHEHLMVYPGTINELENVEKVLHCSSFSLASREFASNSIVDSILKSKVNTNTKWMGEHLAYCRANNGDTTLQAGHTIAPELNYDCLRFMIDNTAKAVDVVGVPIAIENPPLYFKNVNDEFTLFQFYQRLVDSSEMLFLVDLTHLLISAKNLDFNPIHFLDIIPADRLLEIHVSGMCLRSGIWWDDHATPISEEVLELLKYVSDSTSGFATTVELNWAPQSAETPLLECFERVAEIVK